MKWALLIFLLTVFISCGEDDKTDPVVTTCTPACEEWQSCSNGACVTKTDRCVTNDNCWDATKPICNTETHLCEEESGDCNPSCGYWEVCDNGTCKADEGFCDSTRLCLSPEKPICNPESHQCIPESSDCSPACDSNWQFCLSGVCETRVGFCGNNSECTNELLPLCDLELHYCVEDSQACDPLCEIWQVCNEGVCETGAAYCGSDKPCLDPARPVCDSVTHLCKPEDVEYTEPTVLTTVALVVTNNTLKASFEKLALLHTLLGTPTEVVTVEEICSQSSCGNDTPKAIKNYVKNISGLKYLLLGGDIDVVPSREVHDEFSNSILGYSFSETFFTDYYYADFSEWDGNSDGTYAGSGDSPDLKPEIGLSRLPVSTVSEFNNYYEKLMVYLTLYDTTKIKEALLLSNVATEIASVPVDSAQYFEMDGKTVDILSGFNFTKLYADKSSNWGAYKLTVQKEKWALENGGRFDGEIYAGNPNVVVHLGHGSVNLLTTEQDGTNAFTGDDAMALENETASIFLSCACQAGTFSANDSAGEKLILNPDGGAIVYLGDAATGLGVAGGSQLIDEFIRYAFNTTADRILVADAIKAAHTNLPTTDYLTLPIFGQFQYMSVIDDGSWRWTQKVATLLGDHLIPIWHTERDYAPEFTITKRDLLSQNGVDVIIRFSSVISKGVLTLKTSSGVIYKIDVNQTNLVMITINEDPASLNYGFTSPQYIDVFGTKNF
ncbi:hypothetical protein JXR93_01750 [bacterium]|nr:hypothetical protein [bacterium]